MDNIGRKVSASVAITVFAAMIATAPHTACAADYPTKPLTIIVPFSAGGSVDVQGRLIAKGLSERLGKPVVVDNRPGAGGAIGMALAMRAAPDGHTLIMGSYSILVSEPILRGDNEFDPQRDLAPVTLTTEQPLVLVVPHALPVKDLRDLIAQARKQPGKFTYASWGPGSSAHLAGEMFQSSAEVKLVHVPYKGGAPAVTDMIGGHVSMMFGSPFGVVPHVRAGKLRAIAVTGKARMAALPETPTFSEAGISGLDLRVWSCVLVPARTPKEIIHRLNSEITAVLASPDFARAAKEDGVVVVGSSPEELARRIESDVAFVERLARTMKLEAGQ